VIRAEKFLISQPLYAVDLASYGLSESGRSAIAAVWFRRRKGKTVACAGHLWNYLQPCPQTAAEFLAAHEDNRYGGDCAARWDGSFLWCGGPLVQWTEERRDLYSRLLAPMLRSYPDVPEGFDGWWGFE
jgi:hypothetical protein